MTTIESLEIIKIVATVIGSFLGIFLSLFGIIKCYYECKIHCTKKPTNVIVGVREDNDKRYIQLDWTDPKRSKVEKLTCKIESYSINCCLPDCPGIDFNVNEKKFAELLLKDKYQEHRFQITVNYNGRLISAKHSSEPSDSDEKSCFLSAPPSEPNIVDVKPTKDGISLEFESPIHHNGTIMRYDLKYESEEANEEILKIEQFEMKDGHLVANVDMQIKPSLTYDFAMVAIADSSSGETQGKWSENKKFKAPEIGLNDSLFSWSTKEWQVLDLTLIKKSGNFYIDISSYLLGSNSLKICKDSPQEIMKAVLVEWKKAQGENATIPNLIKILNKIELVDLSEILQSEYVEVFPSASS